MDYGRICKINKKTREKNSAYRLTVKTLLKQLYLRKSAILQIFFCLFILSNYERQPSLAY